MEINSKTLNPKKPKDKKPKVSLRFVLGILIKTIGGFIFTSAILGYSWQVKFCAVTPQGPGVSGTSPSGHFTAR